MAARQNGRSLGETYAAGSRCGRPPTPTARRPTSSPRRSVPTLRPVGLLVYSPAASFLVWEGGTQDPPFLYGPNFLRPTETVRCRREPGPSRPGRPESGFPIARSPERPIPRPSHDGPFARRSATGFPDPDEPTTAAPSRARFSIKSIFYSEFEQIGSELPPRIVPRPGSNARSRCDRRLVRIEPVPISRRNRPGPFRRSTCRRSQAEPDPSNSERSSPWQGSDAPAPESRFARPLPARSLPRPRGCRPRSCRARGRGRRARPTSRGCALATRSYTEPSPTTEPARDPESRP